MKRRYRSWLKGEPNSIYFVGGDKYYCSFCKSYIKGYLLIEEHKDTIRHIKNRVIDVL